MAVEIERKARLRFGRDGSGFGWFLTFPGPTGGARVACFASAARAHRFAKNRGIDLDEGTPFLRLWDRALAFFSREGGD